jgi:hypothetical protein
MIRKLAIAALALSLSACATTKTSLPVVTKNNYVAVTIDSILLDLDSCPWPNKPADGANESAYSDYMLDGYKAWACENDTRSAIKKQSERQAAEVEARNKKEPEAVVSGKSKEKSKSWFKVN